MRHLTKFTDALAAEDELDFGGEAGAAEDTLDFGGSVVRQPQPADIALPSAPHTAAASREAAHSLHLPHRKDSIARTAVSREAVKGGALALFRSVGEWAAAEEAAQKARDPSVLVHRSERGAVGRMQNLRVAGQLAEGLRRVETQLARKGVRGPSGDGGGPKGRLTEANETVGEPMRMPSVDKGSESYVKHAEHVPTSSRWWTRDLPPIGEDLRGWCVQVIYPVNDGVGESGSEDDGEGGG